THARRRVVVELTDRHPLVALGPLWRRFHDLERPAGPGADDAVAALQSLGLEVDRQDWESQDRFGFDDLDELVAFTRRRLCLPARRDPEVAAALLEEGTPQGDGIWVSGPPRGGGPPSSPRGGGGPVGGGHPPGRRDLGERPAAAGGHPVLVRIGTLTASAREEPRSGPASLAAGAAADGRGGARPHPPLPPHRPLRGGR